MLAEGEVAGCFGIQEAARRLGVNEQTLRRWIWRGKVKAERSERGRATRWIISTDPVPERQGTTAGAVRRSSSAHGWVDGPGEPDSELDDQAPLEARIEDQIQQLSSDASSLNGEIERLKLSLSTLRMRK